MVDADAAARCSAPNKDGSACNATPGPSGLCRWHSPEMADRIAEGRRRGGKARSNAARAKKQAPLNVLTPIELQAVLSSSIARVLGGQIEPGVANSVAGLARALVAVREATTLEERIAELEQRAGVETRSA